MMRLALAQINPTVGDLVGNQQKIAEYIGRAKAVEADIVVFPELAICGYPPEDLLYKEHFIQDNLRALKFLIKQTKGIAAIIGFVDQDKAKKIYNAAAFISNGILKGVIYKEDLPNYGVFDEKRYFAVGKKSQLFFLNKIKVGVNICEDIWSDNGLAVRQAKLGAQVLINISSSPYHEGKMKLRQKMLIKRAQQTKAFICYTNIVGGQDELVFDGGSLVVNPKGEVMARAKQFQEDLLVVDLEIPFLKPLSRLGKMKVISLSKSLSFPNALIGNLDEAMIGPPIPTIQSGFRPSETSVGTKTFGGDRFGKNLSVNQLAPLLEPTAEVYQALVLGTHDYVRKNDFQKVVIGLSGGIDSALVAAIAADALGPDNVIGVTMPSKFSSQETQSDAKALAPRLGIKLIEVSIGTIFEAYLSTLQKEFKERPFDITEENFQARIRGNILMAFSNKFGWLVLTTGNKSEIAVGYCTLYGDMSGGFAVIKDVPKTKVYALARFRHDQEKFIPQSVFDRAPTAELKDNQKDQDSLPPYAILDPLLKSYVEEHHSFDQLVKENQRQHPALENSEQTVKDVIRLVDKSEYKRRQAPPGIKITPRAFGKDWRLPITNGYKEF